MIKLMTNQVREYRTYADFVEDVRKMNLGSYPELYVAKAWPETLIGMYRKQRRNRPVKRKHVAGFANKARMGQYNALYCEPIKFVIDSTGAPRMVDGQHRALGLAAYGKPVEVMLAVNVPVTTTENIDQTASRARQDVLSMLGIDGLKPVILGDIIKRLDAYMLTIQQSAPTMDDFRRPSSPLDNAEIRAYFEEYRNELMAAQDYEFGDQGKLTSCKHRELRFVRMLTDISDPEKSAAFWEAFSTGENIVKTHPAYWLRAITGNESVATEFAVQARYNGKTCNSRGEPYKCDSLDYSLAQLNAAIFCWNQFAEFGHGGKNGQKKSIKYTDVGYRFIPVYGCGPEDLPIPNATRKRHENYAALTETVDRLLAEVRPAHEAVLEDSSAFDEE